jgi:glycine dehydrogenase
MKASSLLGASDTFVSRHIGPSDHEIDEMLKVVGASSLDALLDQAVPRSIRSERPLAIGPARGEHELLEELSAMARRNRVQRSMIGMGYYDCIVPGVIQRNILENPGWYTQYTPYQAEIAQGRMEALVNFQTMIADLTGLPLANASLLDEATAAAEAMAMCLSIGKKRKGFFVERRTHPQTIEVVRTRAEPLGVTVHVGDLDQIDFAKQDLFGVLVQYPNTEGAILDYSALAAKTHEAGALFVCATDLLALTLLEPPGELGADIAIGSAQRFGVPLGGGGPHAAFISTKDEHKRHLPGRIIGVSKDTRGKPAYRLSLQTREQHIRRDKATSNICTAQVLLAVMSSMYAVYHGPEGLKRIARRVHALTAVLREGLSRLGYGAGTAPVFDTLKIQPMTKKNADQHDEAFAALARAGYGLRRYQQGGLGVSLDETTTLKDVQAVLDAFGGGIDARALAEEVEVELPERFRRKSAFLTHPIFNSFHAEHEMLRYIKRLEAKDLSLTTSMIPLGSCTMKLNGTAEMVPVTWPEFGNIHPFAPAEEQAGYLALFDSLEKQLMDVTGFPAISLQPNAGSQGEYTGLLVIRAYHRARGEQHRNVCLIPTSAHGTNPASAAMAGMKVVVVECDDHGNIDLGDLEAKAKKHAAELAALMVTYPSTHGVFESGIRRICTVVHEHGGQVYMDGANMNAQVGICRPAEYGADVVHLNLHKTFCIPHGGGGPGMGPIGVAAHLAPYLPGHPFSPRKSGEKQIGPVSAAPYGSPSILTIPWVYISLMGSDGLRKATAVAILAANYMAKRLQGHFDVLYTGESGRVAHEFIVDMRPFKRSAGIEVDDIAKRLMDYGFHAPTMSFPVAGTMMIEPTESESKAELDRLCDALISIRQEIRAIEEGRLDKTNNPLTNAPHTLDDLAGAWDRPYSREQAVLPAPWLKRHKFWPSVGRVDNPWGDRNLFCTCPPMQTE